MDRPSSVALHASDRWRYRGRRVLAQQWTLRLLAVVAVVVVVVVAVAAAVVVVEEEQKKVARQQPTVRFEELRCVGEGGNPAAALALVLDQAAKYRLPIA